jgi:hypothetical protein
MRASKKAGRVVMASGAPTRAVRAIVARGTQVTGHSCGISAVHKDYLTQSEIWDGLLQQMAIRPRASD